MHNMMNMMMEEDQSELTLAQIKASEQPRDHKGRFVSNRELSLEDEDADDFKVVPLGLQANAFGDRLEFGEDPFEDLDAQIDFEMSGDLMEDYEFLEDQYEPPTAARDESPEARKVRHAQNSQRRIEAARQRWRKHLH